MLRNLANSLGTKGDRYRSSLALSYTHRQYIAASVGYCFYLCKVLREPRSGKTTAPHFLFCIMIPHWGVWGKKSFYMIYKVKKCFPATLVLEEKDTGKEVTVQLLNGTSVYETNNDAIAKICGIVPDNYTIVCYNDGDCLMQDKLTNKQVYLSEVIKEPASITEDSHIVLYDWVSKR